MNKNNNMTDGLRKAEHGLVKAERMLLFLCMIVLTASIMIQIVGRYVLKVGTPWCEELARYLFIAMTYIGAGTAFTNIGHGGHINIDLMDTLIEKYAKDPAKVQAVFNRFAAILGEIVIIGFTYIYVMYLQTIAKRPQESASMHINMLIPMSFVLIGLVLMVIHCGLRLFYSYDAETTEEEEK